MRLQIFSDLHLEFADFRPPETEADAVVLAGDIAPGCDGLPWAAAHFAGKPVIFVAGNHEFYGCEMHRHLADLRRLAKLHRVHFLERDEIVIDGVRFLGCTLWTDFGLFGAEHWDWLLGVARLAMNDYERILAADDFTASSEGRRRALQPEDTVEIHRRSVAWLARRLQQPFPGPTVVVTHHAPHPFSLPPGRDRNPLSAAYATDLTRLMGSVALWVHGHVHASSDYPVRGTRVVCNPRGYAPYAPNPRFDAALVIEA